MPSHARRLNLPFELHLTTGNFGSVLRGSHVKVDRVQNLPNFGDKLLKSFRTLQETGYNWSTAAQRFELKLGSADSNYK